MSYKGNSSVQLTKAERSTFDFSHEKRTTTRMGRLTNVLIFEVLPNDTWFGRLEVLIKFAPLLFPVFARMNVFVHWHFVPNRILASWFPDFIGGGRLGEYITTPPVPSRFTFASIGARAKSLLAKSTTANYMGIPPMSDAAANALGSRTIDVLPFAAWYKVWYDWYRDRNYEADNNILPLAAGTISAVATIDAFMETKWRSWEPDMFTTASVSTQRGAQVLMPLSGSGNVTYLNQSLVQTSAGAGANPNTLIGTDGAPQLMTVNKATAAGAGTAGRIENIQSVNITTSSVSINDTRMAFALQRWLEINMWGGSRMDETIWIHFNKKTSDARLQMAEYLGGSKTPVQITELLSTSETVSEPQGAYAGNASSYGSDNSFSYNAEEWGFLLATLSVMPHTSYKQGIPSMFVDRNTFLKYPFPTLAHLGEEKVYNWQLYFDGTSYPVDPTTAPTFGYQSRYYLWKQAISFDSGDFYDNMESWTLTRKFASQPVLGKAFVEFDNALQNQIFVDSAADTLWCYIYADIKVKRSLPYYGTPKLVG